MDRLCQLMDLDSKHERLNENNLLNKNGKQIIKFLWNGLKEENPQIKIVRSYVGVCTFIKNYHKTIPTKIILQIRKMVSCRSSRWLVGV